MTSAQIATIISNHFPDEASFDAVVANLALTVQLRQVEIEIANLDSKTREMTKPIDDMRFELNNKRQAIVDTMAAQLPIGK